MQKPNIPEKEKERLQEVVKYNLTNELTDDSMESIVEIASEICKTPISLISIVGEEKQFFKARKGLKVKETSRDVSFCAHAINNPHEIFIVEDASNDLRFHDNPLVVSEPFIRFYAGIPILSPDNYSLGTLCVIDKKPNKLSEKQKSALRQLGKQVTLILELQKKNELLEVSKRQLKIHAEDMEDYAHLISHDLKEPVRGINSFLEKLTEKYMTQLDEKGQEYIRFAHCGAVKINQLIEDLLDYSKTARISGSMKPIDLNEVMDEVLESIKFLRNERGAEVNIHDSLPTINGIESGLTQMFYNLINNSLKFVPKGRTPKIDISSETSASEYIIEIKDNGVGIPASQLKNIFNIFRRVPSNEDYPGTGVGLAIVKKVASIHNAKVNVESEVGVGSKFIISFPKEIEF